MIEYPTIRYRCGHCRKSYARKGSCATHEAECHLDPAVRACTTCVHFEPGRPLANGCAVDAFYVTLYHARCEQHQRRPTRFHRRRQAGHLVLPLLRSELSVSETGEYG